MIKAIITLTPLEPYFFGSEATHGNGIEANYFAKSNRWPQQSTVLGVLRHLLHETGHNRGKHSFMPDSLPKEGYGDLIRMSPLFLRYVSGKGKESRYYLRQALDRQKGSKASIEIMDGSATNLFLNEHLKGWQETPIWTGFDKKKSMADEWVCPADSEPVEADDIFIEFTRPGITKKPDEERRKRETGLYKQTAYRLADGWSFAVLAEFKSNVDLKKLNGICLPIGGEKTVFAIAAQTEQRSFEEIFPKQKLFYTQGNKRPPRLVLVSDAFLPDEALQYMSTGVTETIDFRHIRTHESVNNFGPLHQLLPGEQADNFTDRLTKSVKYSLIRRGAILLCKDPKDPTALSKLTTALDIKPWKIIGFNYFFSY